MEGMSLKGLCYYYLNCIALESSSSVSQFLTSKNGIDYAVLNGLRVEAPKDIKAIKLLERISFNPDKKAYLGYPIRIFSIHTEKGIFRKIAPIFMFPVEIAGGRICISWVPAINMEIIKAFANGGTETLTNELVSLESDLGMDEPNAEISPYDLVLRLRKERQWDWAEDIDPYNIPTATDLGQFGDGIWNRPIIIEAEKGRFTLGLEAELMRIATLEEKEYRETALYSWLNGLSNSPIDANIKPILEVLSLNSEQAQAVDTALRSDMTVVTGPPGTGKSQVVTDLLVNAAWNGKSALFSSKNNKAVDVVEARVNALSKKPAILRLRSNMAQAHLADIVEGLLLTAPSAENRKELEFYQSEYSAMLEKMEELKKKKASIIDARNQIDSLERMYCSVRNRVEPFWDVIEETDIGKVIETSRKYADAYKAAIKANNSVLARCFWLLIKSGRINARNRAASSYNRFGPKYGLPIVDENCTLETVEQLVRDAEQFDKSLEIALKYKKQLERFHEMESLEDIDKQLFENKVSTSQIAKRLWGTWLVEQGIPISQLEKKQMLDFLTAVKLAGDTGTLPKSMINSTMELLKKYLPCVAVTSLSVRGKVPFDAGIFDYVIIDEASQCDIASMIPLLYRAKSAVIIGDPKQLTHISNLSRQQDTSLIRRFNVPLSWSYSKNSAYDVAHILTPSERIVQLRDHFRSCAEIIEFSNQFFYNGSLRTATKYDGLNPPLGEKPGIKWIDIKGQTVRPQSGSAFNEAEAYAVIRELKRIVESGYSGTIGVTTPYREQVTLLKFLLERKENDLFHELVYNHEFIVDTIHKFQGDEKDVIIFSTVVTDYAPRQTLGFLNITGNLFNVAISRARAMLMVVGDYSYCSKCEVDYLNKFTRYYAKLSYKAGKQNNELLLSHSNQYPWVSNPELVSEWEKVFFTALADAGIKTIPQYTEEKYRLDLAIIKANGAKLDIEIDGEMYHRQWNGELSYRDQLRNQRLFELGWDVMRFWVFQIRDEMPLCIEKIKQWNDSH